MVMIKANFNLIIDFFAIFMNRVTPRYFSAAWKCESLGKNFFKHRISKQDFCWFFPPPRLFWLAYIYSHNEKSKGVWVFALWFSLPITNKFVYKNHLSRSVVLFRMLETKINCHSKASYKFFNKKTVIVFEFDMDLSNPLQTNFNRTHCVLAGCPFCLY